ncbi:MAG: molecular chaperone HtpG [Clostridia bacterium]|nr:molecular chaperone HtpG [Clostridia bacterium]
MFKTRQGNLSVNSENLLPIIKKWLYSEKDIFIRELVSNANDAIAKLRGLAGIGEAEVAEDEVFRIDVFVNRETGELRISDNGIGMTAEEVEKYINQVAFSGAKDFLAQYKDKSADAQILGHFGLGFYSAFMAADLVTIDTLSHRPGAEAVRWVSADSAGYEMGPSDRETRGTTITLHMAEDSREFLEYGKIHSVLLKYFRFLPYEIYLHDAEKPMTEDAPETPINVCEPLWNKKPSECTEEEYKKFYHEVFTDFSDPLLYVHLNIDYPFRLRGILYFPRMKNEMQNMEGEVKLYCNQVFVADNIKEVIPEYLLLLKGCIDCPDLPLNVSRSFLQSDATVQRISAHISKKVSDRLCSLFEKERETYCTDWKDINPFVKFGCLRDEKFYERMKKALIFETIDGEFKTVDEYVDALPAKDAEGDRPAEKRVYYVTDAVQQAAYIDLFREKGIAAVVLSEYIDTYFISFLESKTPGLHFLRIDSDLSDLAGGEGADISAAEELFGALDENVRVRAEALGAEALPAVLLQSETTRRFRDMSRMYGGDPAAFPMEEELVLNSASPVISAVARMAGSEDTRPTAELIAREIRDLARLHQAPLTAEQMKEFTKRTVSIMTKLMEEK